MSRPEGKVHHLPVFAHQHQFRHRPDARRTPVPSGAAGGRVERIAVRSHRIAPAPHLVAVGTARAGWFEVTLREHEHAPAAGEVSVFGPTGTG